MEHEDFLETLQIMKQIGTLNDVYEINPQLHLIVFSKEPFKLTQAEKVVLSFVANEDILTVNRLQEGTQWKADYANKVVQGLIDKKYLQIIDNNLVVTGMISPTERKQRQELLNAIKQKKEQKMREMAPPPPKEIESKPITQPEKPTVPIFDVSSTEEMASTESEIVSETNVSAVTDENAELDRMKSMPKPMIKDSTNGTRTSSDCALN